MLLSLMGSHYFPFGSESHGTASGEMCYVWSGIKHQIKNLDRPSSIPVKVTKIF